jgi:hypothetical protein
MTEPGRFPAKLSGEIQMAKSSRNTPKAPADEKAKKTAAEVKGEIVARVRKAIRRSVARLNAAEVRSSGNPEGNWNLIKAYKAFDAELDAIVNPKQPKQNGDESDAQ